MFVLLVAFQAIIHDFGKIPLLLNGLMLELRSHDFSSSIGGGKWFPLELNCDLLATSTGTRKRERR
jgi:hypothetical protein